MRQVSLKPSGPRRTRRTRLGCLYAFLAPFVAFSLFFLGAGIHHLRDGRTREGWIIIGVALLSLTASGLFLAFGIRSHRRNQAQLEFEAEHPAAPWLWRPEWRDGRIRSTDKKSATLFWIMAIGFIGISLPAVLAIPKELAKGNKPILLALIFPIAGVGLGVAAARATIRVRKFGHSELELHTRPGVLGGTLSGAVQIPSKVRTDSGFELRLACIRRTTSGSGKNRSTTERVLWEERKTIVRDFLEHERDMTGLPVFFSVPFDQPESLEGNPAILWRLEIAAEVPGVDYAAQFEVPVFKTSESRAHADPPEDPTAPFQPPPEAWTPPASSRITVSENTRGQTEIRFPPARHPLLIMGLLLFITIWTAAIWFMIDKKAPLLFPIVFGFFELLLILFAFQLMFHSVKVTADRSAIVVAHRVLLLSWKRTVPSGEVRSIDLKSGMQSGTKVYYDLVLSTAAGRTLNAGGRVADKQHAQWIASRISEVTGLGS